MTVHRTTLPDECAARVTKLSEAVICAVLGDLSKRRVSQGTTVMRPLLLALTLSLTAFAAASAETATPGGHHEECAAATADGAR